MIKTDRNKKEENFFESSLVAAAPSEQHSSDLREKVMREYTTYYETRMNSKSTFSVFAKKYTPFIAGTFILLLLAIPSFLFINSNTEEQDTDVSNNLAAEVSYIEGTVEYRESEESGWFAAEIDTAIKEGFELRTVGEGRAIINLDDGSAVRVAEDASVEFSSMDPNNIVITNTGGEIYSRIEKLDRDFTVVVEDTIYQSLGTAYKTVNEADQKGVIVYQSDVSVQGVTDEEILVKEGNQYFTENKDSKKKNKVTEVSKEDINKDEFALWNKEQDEQRGDDTGVFSSVSDESKTDTAETEKEEEKKEETTTPAPTPAPTTPAPVASMSVTSIENAGTGKFKISWNTSNVDTSNGFKVNYSTSPNPAYGGANTSSQYVGDGNARTAYVSNLQTGTYYVNVCKYTGNGCDTYTSQVSISITGAQSISSISLTKSGNTLNWTTDTGGTGNGFKVVRNATGNPTYPGDNPTFTNDTNFEVTQSGFYRVCAYTGSGCNAYSNEIEVIL